eukprot:155211-Rhodomonas_salina.2
MQSVQRSGLFVVVETQAGSHVQVGGQPLAVHAIMIHPGAAQSGPLIESRLVTASGSRRKSVWDWCAYGSVSVLAARLGSAGSGGHGTDG